MINRLDHLNLNVKNFQQSKTWYEKVFDFKTCEHGEIKKMPWGILRAGNAMLCLYESPETGRSSAWPENGSLNHFALNLSDREAWLNTIDKFDLNILYGGMLSWPNSDSWYLKDPDGYEIEVVFWRNGGPKFHPV